jgi:hypothetical protein
VSRCIAAQARADSGSLKTHHSPPAAAGPEKPAIARIKRFDPFRGWLLYLFDELSLRKGSRQRGHNVNVISNAADVHEFGVKIAADCCQLRMHAWPHVGIEPRLAILCAENDVNDDSTE